ncbi:MAG: tetratricopeptide repeat protein [Steroidobacteraceae bacterium]
MDLLSEEEQTEYLRKWLRENGPFLIGVVVAALLAVGGWRWWLARGESNAVAANAAYEKILQTFDAGQTDSAVSLIEALRGAHPKSGYVTAADLAAARIFVSAGELDKAEARLKDVLASLKDQKLRPVVTLRLARVQSALGRNDDALATLGTANQGAFEAAFAETRGDVLLAKGDSDGALREYEAARALIGPDASGTGVEALLELKINDLKPAAATAAPAAPAAGIPEEK